MNSSKRRARLVELLDRLNDGHDITSRDMKIVLTNEEHKEYIQMWDAEKDKRNPVKPKSVKDYEKLLNQWHISEARVQKYRYRQNKIQSTLMKMSHEIDSCLEKIQEYLLEHRNDSEFNLWLDRQNKSSDPNETINPECPINSLDTPPMVVTSRSLSKQSAGVFQKYSKREVKKMILEKALSELDSPSAEIDIEEIMVELKSSKGNKPNKDKFKGIKV